MSAFLCEPATFALAALGSLHPDLRLDDETRHEIKPLAEVYRVMNNSALEHRYPSDPDMIWHNEVDARLHFLSSDPLTRAFTVRQAMECLIYQCCEGTINKTRPYEILSAALKRLKRDHPTLGQNDGKLPHLWSFDTSEDGKHLLDHFGKPRELKAEITISLAP